MILIPAIVAQKEQLEEILSSDALTTITGSYAFENCTALTSLDFSNCKVVTLYTRAFADCINLTRFRFGQSKPSINAASFTGVTGCTFVFQKKSHYTSLSATSTSSFRYWIEKGEGMSNTVDWIEEDV